LQGGDISNGIPPRVAVTLDCIIDRKPTFKRILGIPVVGEDVSYNRQALSMFWRFSDKYGYSMELVGFDMTKKEMQQVQDDLDNLGTNPFNYYLRYNVVADLVAELPYRPELIGVVDIPARALRYGSRYLDLRGKI